MGDSYESVLFQLGDIAYERLWNKPNPPRVMPKVIEAAEAYEQRQVELREIESAMDEEEPACQEFVAACKAEIDECKAIAAQHRRAADALEAQLKPLEASLNKKQRDVAVGKEQVQKLEERVRIAEEQRSGDLPAIKEHLKRTRIETMRASRACDEIQSEIEKLLTPEVSGVAVEGLQARRRIRDLEQQLVDRQRASKETLQTLDEQAQDKDAEIQHARQYFDEMIMMLGQEVHQMRISDPALAVFYPKLDKLKR